MYGRKEEREEGRKGRRWGGGSKRGRKRDKEFQLGSTGNSDVTHFDSRFVTPAWVTFP